MLDSLEVSKRTSLVSVTLLVFKVTLSVVRDFEACKFFQGPHQSRMTKSELGVGGGRWQ